MIRFALLTSLMLLAGCQSTDKADQIAATPPSHPQAPAANQADSQPANQPGGGFSFGNVMRMAGFQQGGQGTGGQGAAGQAAAGTAGGWLPPEVMNLSNVVNTIAARSAELSINDPPEVTRQKAIGILDSLRPWDSMMAAGRSVGLINDQTAQQLNSFVGPLRAELQKLIDKPPSVQTIGAVQYLARGLQTSVNGLMGWMGRLNTAAAPGHPSPSPQP